MSENKFFSFQLGKEARSVLYTALYKVANAVGSTLGPGGMPFGFDLYNLHQVLSPSYTKDGITVLKALRFNTPHENAVLEYCKQASLHSVVASGDGTTSTIILAEAVARMVNNNSRYPQAFAREILADSVRAANAIKAEAMRQDEAVRKVALTSSNGDEELVDVVIEAINQSSAFGTLNIDKNPISKERYLIEKQDGYGYTKGYDWHSPLAVSVTEDAASNKNINWGESYVALYNGALYQPSQIEQLLRAWQEACSVKKGNLIVVAYDVGQEVGNTMMVLNRKLAANAGTENLRVMAVQTKLTGEPNGPINILRDMAAYTGIRDKFIIDGANQSSVTKDYLGSVKSVRIGPGSSLLLGRSDNHWVEERVQQNQELVSNARNMFAADWAKYRNAELSGGLVKIVLGGGSMPDLQERADRLDDASKAAQACMREGALPGGGLSYIRAGELANVNPALKEALRSVYNRVLENYGSDPDRDLVPEKGAGYSITADKGIVEGEALELGVLDSYETISSVIRNGTALGVMIATMGGFLYRTDHDSKDLLQHSEDSQ